MKIPVNRPEGCVAELACDEGNRNQSRFLSARYTIEASMRCGSEVAVVGDTVSDFDSDRKGQSIPDDTVEAMRSRVVHSFEAKLARICAACPRRQPQLTPEA